MASGRREWRHCVTVTCMGTEPKESLIHREIISAGAESSLGEVELDFECSYCCCFPSGKALRTWNLADSKHVFWERYDIRKHSDIQCHCVWEKLVNVEAPAGALVKNSFLLDKGSPYLNSGWVSFLRRLLACHGARERSLFGAEEGSLDKPLGRSVLGMSWIPPGACVGTSSV